MSKYAVLSLSEALEQELEGTNVGVTALCPGPIATNLAQGARHRPDHLGGPQLRPAAEAALAERLARTGIDPKLVGEVSGYSMRSATRPSYAFVSAVPAGPRDQGAPPPHRGGARDPLDDGVLGDQWHVPP